MRIKTVVMMRVWAVCTCIKFGLFQNLIVVKRFEYVSDPESYTSGSVVTGRASLAGQVKG